MQSSPNPASSYLELLSRVTVKKKRGGEFFSISPLQRVTNRGLSRGRLKARRCWVKTREPEPVKKRPLHLKHKTRAHNTNGEKVKSGASQVFVLHFVFGWKVVYSTSCPQERGQCVRFAGITVHVEDKSVNTDTLFSR